MAPVTITVHRNGSIKVEGPAQLRNADGEPISTPEGKPFYLCRCGASGNKPFCDGTHKRIGFQAD